MIKVFFKIYYYKKHTPSTFHKATLLVTQALGFSLEQLDIEVKSFDVVLDKSHEKSEIFVIFGTKLKLISRNRIGDYVEKAT